MADISVGSVVFVVTAFLVISTLVLLLLRYYLPLRSTPGYLLLPVFLALALPSSIILLVPIDLASSEVGDTHEPAGIWLPPRALQALWRVTYWLTFVLTWALLPILGEYCDSGDKDIRARIQYAIRTNIRYQMIGLAVGSATFVYIVLVNGFHLSSLRGLIMALAYAWGLFLAIGLMGHGLVTLPRRLFRSANIAERLKQIQSRAPMLKEKLDGSIDELAAMEHTVGQLKQRKTGMSRDMQEWVDELADTCELPDTRMASAVPRTSDAPNIPAIVTERYLAELTRKLKRARHKKARFIDEWTRLCYSAQHTQTILDSASTKTLEFDHMAPGQRASKLLNPTTRFYTYTYIIPYSTLGLAVLLGWASLSIVWSEVVSGLFPKVSLIGLTTFPNQHTQFAFGNQIIAAAWLLYMCTTTLYALSDVKVWGNRALVRRQTYGESACWYALQVAKFTVPLSYNFITMVLSRNLYEKTKFYALLGRYIDITPLGEKFSEFFPCFILITALAALFNLWTKIGNYLGFGVLEDDEDSTSPRFGSGSWREGKTLIERELSTQHRPGVGLSSRGDSMDIERQAYSDNPTRSQPAPRTRMLNAVTNEEDLDESPRHFYQDFGERIKNTFDTAETPQWMKNIGDGFKTPKWMQRDSQQETTRSGRPNWFGGGSDDGRVRL